MEFRVPRDVFADVVTWAARGLPPRPPIPVLAGVKIEASQGVLKFSSFDYEVSARFEVEAEVIEDGEVLVSGRLLAEIAKALPNLPVTVKLEDNKVSVVCGASRFNLLIMPIDDYPELPEVPNPVGTVDAAEFSRAITQVTLAASKEETLPVLASVHVAIDGEKITLMASDRYRLAQRTVAWKPADSSFETTALIKSKVLSDMSKSFPNVGDMSLSMATLSPDLPGATSAIFGMSMSGRQMTSQLTDGDYPELQKLFPTSTPINAVLERKELSEALKRMRLVSERGGRVRFRFRPGSLTLEAGEGQEAQASEEINCTLQGEEITAEFNPDFLLEGVEAMDEDYVHMGFISSDKASMIMGQAEKDGPQNQNYRYLVMPLHLGS